MVDTAPDVRAAGSARPRLVVSVTASVDGRVTLNRASRLLDEAAGRIWDSIHPASADAMVAARRAEIERRYAPQVVLEGSGTFVADTDGPVTRLPVPCGDIAALFDDFLPAGSDCRCFAVVDGRGRIRWASKEDAGRRLLVIVSRTTPAPYLAHLRSEDVPYLVAGDGPVDLRGFGSSTALPQPFRILLAETQNGCQSFVDTPLLVWGDPPHQVAKPPGVDGADLLDEDAASLAQQFYLRAEGRGPGTERRRRDQDY